MLSCFPSITSCKLGNLVNVHADTLKKIFSWRYLRFLLLHIESSYNTNILLEGHCTCLQELYIYAYSIVPAETFINALCGHGCLEHVVLHVYSLTARSITSLIEHSPDLVTFKINVNPISWMEDQITQLIASIRTRFCKIKLINGGLFSMELYEFNPWLGDKHLKCYEDPWIF